jgi:glutathione S-transferase
MATCTKRVAIVCNEIGLKYEIIPIDMANGAHKAPEYLDTMQPFGVIPVLEVGSTFSLPAKKLSLKLAASGCGRHETLRVPCDRSLPYSQVRKRQQFAPKPE